MRPFAIFSVLSLMLLASACSTNRGGTAENYDTITATETSPLPPGSPTERPGMAPQDPRDPQHATQPQFLQTPTNP